MLFNKKRVCFYFFRLQSNIIRKNKCFHTLIDQKDSHHSGLTSSPSISYTSAVDDINRNLHLGRIATTSTPARVIDMTLGDNYEVEENSSSSAAAAAAVK